MLIFGNLIRKYCHYRESLEVPEDKVDTDDTLWLGVLAVVDDSGLGFHPNKASSLGQHPVLACADLALCKHYPRETKV